LGDIDFIDINFYKILPMEEKLMFYFDILKAEYQKEIYEFIDKNYKKLPKNSKGNFDETQDGFVDNDVDALRHAYVSGRFVHKYNSTVSNILGLLNEKMPVIGGRSLPGGLKEENMDLWNNAVGRKYGKQTKTPEELFERLIKALKNGELIIDLNDKRNYDGNKFTELKDKKDVIVIEESKTGENLLFFDSDNNLIMTKPEFIALILEGKYPSYEVRNINNKETPVSKKDKTTTNNLC
jgi:hypothetical protein